MRQEVNVPGVSPYLQNDIKALDPMAEMPTIINMPLKIFRDSQHNWEVLRLRDSLNLSETKDEFAHDTIVDLYFIMYKIFLIDGRIYKHYRLLPWFPKYMEFFYRSQLLIMDNNDGGEEELQNQSENDIFPKHLNYYLAIMAVSCYRCEYLLCIL